MERLDTIGVLERVDTLRVLGRVDTIGVLERVDTFDVADEAPLLTLTDDVRNWPPGTDDDEEARPVGVPEDVNWLLPGPFGVCEVDWLGKTCVVLLLELTPEEEGVSPTMVSAEEEDCWPAGGLCDGRTYGFETLLTCVCVLLPFGPVGV